MITEKQMERYADVLIWALKTARKDRFKKGDVILIRYDRQAVRLAEILFSRIMDMGMNPIQRIMPTPTMERSFFEKADNKQLAFRIPGDEELYHSLNGSIFLHAPDSITHLSGIDPKKIGKLAVAKKYLRDILEKREEQGDFGWTLCMHPTEELARHAGLTLKEYANQVIRACFINKTAAVDEWKSVYKKAAGIKKWLNSLDVDRLHVESDNMDLIVAPGAQRRWIGISGHNIPSFELFLSPDWRGTEGVYYADQPSFRSGNYVEGVRLAFKKGVVTECSAKTGEDFLKKQVAMDKGAGRVGEFSLTDKRFSKINRFMANTLFDENFGGREGNCHLALGASYSDSFSGDPGTLTKKEKENLGFNDSALHWDLVNTEKKRVTAHLADGGRVVIYENGMFAR